jgi:type IV fimbrial biogenesis protein FimT
MISCLPRRRNDQGFTIVELMIVILIVAVLLVLGVPAFNDLVDEYRIKSAADSLHSDLQFARSEAIRTNSNVCIGFATGANWCYGMNLTASTAYCDTSTCDCSISNTADAQYCSLKRATSTDFPGVAMPAAGNVTFPANVTGFEPLRGLTGVASGGAALSGSVRFDSSRGRQATVTLTPIGRASVCSPTDSVPGYPAC